MIARLQGILESVDGTLAVIAADTQGPCAWEVYIPAFASDTLLTKLGAPLTLFTVQVLEGSSQGANLTPRLIGFPSPDDRKFFELFTTVKGLGTRRALRAMAHPPHEIALWITQRDAKALQRLPEIGKRLAETIIAELTGKVERFMLTAAAQAAAHSGGHAGGVIVNAVRPAQSSAADLPENAAQALEALVRLGESRAEAQRRFEKLLNDRPDLATASPDELLTAAFAIRS